jgi:hypothetical protein
VLAFNKWDVSRTDLEDIGARARKMRLRPPVHLLGADRARVTALLRTRWSLPSGPSDSDAGAQPGGGTSSPRLRRPRGRLRLYYTAQIGSGRRASRSRSTIGS